MPILVVVDNISGKPFPLREIEGVEIVTARSFLLENRYFEARGAKVFNLCRSYRYQSIGYYVSLLAAARGQRPVPSVNTMQEMKTAAVLRVAGDDLDDLIQKSLAQLRSDHFTLSIYFGRNVAKRYDRLSLELFKTFPVPLLRATFRREPQDHHWSLASLRPIATGDVPPEHHDFLRQVAAEHFRGRRTRWRRRRAPRYDLAILHNSQQPQDQPSDPRALQRFVDAAAKLGMAAELVTKADYGRLAEFDALFIRETTNVNHHTFRFSRRAASEGLVVIDDPESILRCTNKVFLAELLARYRIPAPKTLVIHRDNIEEAIGVLGMPCILKKPDSAFSEGVIKVENAAALGQRAAEMLERSELIIGQSFLPTEFDWRIGVLDHRAIFACRYFMAKKHWQVVRRDHNGCVDDEGTWQTIPVEDAPSAAVGLALAATRRIGDGLYGVDIKEHGGHFFVIEVNDNPNIDAGVEDQILGKTLYETIMASFLVRIERRKQV